MCPPEHEAYLVVWVCTQLCAPEHTHKHTHTHTQVDYWLEYVCANVNPGAGLEAVLVAINDYLALRSFLVGHATTVADVVLWGQLQGKHHAETSIHQV